MINHQDVNMNYPLSASVLQGKVALVTGGSRGIGEAIALGLAKAGSDVIITSRNLPDLEKVAGDIKSLGRKSLGLSAHAGKLDDINNLVEKVKDEFGKIDILVNNAATNPTVDPALYYSERAWDAIMNLNLKGLFFLSQAVAKIMKEKDGGSIINISSAEGITPSALTVYGISKAGVIYTTRALAKEWGKYNIRVNAIAPGIIRTRFAEFWWKNPEALKFATSMTPLGRTGEPQDIVGAAVYFASSASSHVTGQVLVIDGGFSI